MQATHGSFDLDMATTNPDGGFLPLGGVEGTRGYEGYDLKIEVLCGILTGSNLFTF